MGMLPTYFFRKFIYILHGIWAIPVVMVIRIIRPIILIKVGTFLHTRIGHFAADVGQEWAKYNSKEENPFYRHFYPIFTFYRKKRNINREESEK